MSVIVMKYRMSGPVAYLVIESYGIYPRQSVQCSESGGYLNIYNVWENEPIVRNAHYKRVVSESGNLIFNPSLQALPDQQLDEQLGITAESGGSAAQAAGTGYASYKDTQYTMAAPFRLLAGQEMILPNNAGTKLEDQLPVGVGSFYQASSQKITPAASGDGLNYQIIFQARPTVAGAKLDIGIDIGGSFGKIFNPNYTVGVEAGQVDKVFIGIPGSYVGDTFLANGGQIKVTASQDVEVWGMTYIISRYHKAR